jgi:diacylglycerol kinase family enzyme
VAAAIAIARTWWHLRKLTAAMSIDSREIVRHSPFIVVGNGGYVLSGLSLGQREEISDGRLSLYVAPSTGRIGVLSLPFRARRTARGRALRNDLRQEDHRHIPPSTNRDRHRWGSARP